MAKKHMKSYVDIILINEIPISEVYYNISTPFTQKSSKYAFELLTNNKIRKILEQSEYYNKLLNLILYKEEYTAKYMCSKYCSIEDKNYLFTIILNNLRNYLSVLDDYNNLKYLIEFINTPNSGKMNVNDYYILGSRILKYFVNENENNKILQCEILDIVIDNKNIIGSLVFLFSGWGIEVDKKILKQIYIKYKDDIFSTRKGVHRLYNSLKLFEDLVEIKYIRKVLSAINKKKCTYLIDEFEKDINKYKLTKDELELIDADIMMYKIAS